ncbi:MAG: aromatic ring-hydroxylating dioxygenase subunit alpha [Rhodospirillales bacterium]|nr:aromatic ring-hydroxylating dioxygenase subunit alpha [Rhodospirillales bacterium]
MATQASSAADYAGYHQTRPGGHDELLVRVGPGTPAGEYLRRYWQPVNIADELGVMPKLIRVLGEQLVLFRDKSGRIGLVHKNCPHRRASMEFGVCETRGIRCCYHGWLFDVDGTILEAPGQPDDVEERLRAATRLGAYPVREYKGLIFAYLGPPEGEPEFPLYDTLDMPDHTTVPYKAPFGCNWIQVLDAILDPLHTAFLHSRMSREQFSHGFGEIGEFKFYERPTGFFGTATRRVDDNVWIRVNELVLPNYTQAGAAFAADGTQQRYFGRTSFARWVVPIDDHETMCFAWAIFGERGDPESYNTPEGPELIEQGEVFDRPYEERQRYPADVEACEGMGTISEHTLENLVPSDKGIQMYRRRLRELIRALENGDEPLATTAHFANPVPTYGGDTVLRMPSNGDDRALLQKVGMAVMEIQFAAEGLPEDERTAQVIAGLKALEEEGLPA